MQVNVLQAKTDFSKLIHLLEAGKEKSITVARNGTPVAKITLIDGKPVSKRTGIAQGKYKAPDDFEATNDEAAAMLVEGVL